MSFYRLAVSMMLLLMLLLLGGVLSIQFLDSKRYVEEQLYLNAQNTASSLSLSLTSAKGDLTRMKTMINAVFDNGFYEAVELLDKHHIPLYSKTQKPQMGDVPEWFVKVIDIDPLYAEAQVSSGWTPTGFVRVKSDRGIAYRQMYRIFKNTVYTFIFFMLAGFLMLHFLLKLALVPLNRIQMQAEAVLRNRFVTQKDTSAVKELRKVESAMNNMIDRVREIFQKNEEILKRNHEILYKDELTKLFNRRYLILKLSEFLHADDSRSGGSVAIIKINGISDANKKIGYKKSDNFLQEFAAGIEKICSSYDESVAARINAAEFSMLMPGVSTEDVLGIIAGVKENFLSLQKRFGLELSLSMNAGVSIYRHDESLSAVFARLDNLLAEASIKEEGVAFSCDKDNKELGKEEWREVIASAVRADRLTPVLQPVIDTESGETLYNMMFFDIVTSQRVYRYGEFVPMAILLGQEFSLMNSMFEQFRYSALQRGKVAIEVFGTLLKESESFLLLEKKIIETASETKGSLVIEIAEKDIASMDRYFLERLSSLFEKKGIESVVSRAGANNGNYRYLEYLKPSYVKMHSSIYLDMDESSRNAFRMLIESMGIELIIVGRNDELQLLKNENVRYTMNIREVKE